MEITKESVSAFNKMLFEDGFMDVLGGDHAMRSLLDCLCCEWESTTLDQKVHAFHVFKDRGFSVDDVVQMFCARFQNSSKKEYIIQDVPQACEAIYNHAIACGDTYVSEGLKYHRPAGQIAASTRPATITEEVDWKPGQFFEGDQS